MANALGLDKPLDEAFSGPTGVERMNPELKARQAVHEQAAGYTGTRLNGFLARAGSHPGSQRYRDVVTANARLAAEVGSAGSPIGHTVAQTPDTPRSRRGFTPTGYTRA